MLFLNFSCPAISGRLVRLDSGLEDAECTKVWTLRTPLDFSMYDVFVCDLCEHLSTLGGERL